MLAEERCDFRTVNGELFRGYLGRMYVYILFLLLGIAYQVTSVSLWACVCLSVSAIFMKSQPI